MVLMLRSVPDCLLTHHQKLRSMVRQIEIYRQRCSSYISSIMGRILFWRLTMAIMIIATRQTLSPPSSAAILTSFEQGIFTSPPPADSIFTGWYSGVFSRRQVMCKTVGDIARVDGQLAVATSFGDKSLKEHMSSEPDVFVELIDDDFEIIILASDGM